MKTIACNAIIGTITAKVDRSIGARFTTPELTSGERAMFFELQNQQVSLLISPLDRQPEGEYKIEKDLEQKPPSVRLRNVFYLLFKQDAEGHPDFDSYYRAKMEKVIENFKTKIQETYER